MRTVDGRCFPSSAIKKNRNGKSRSGSYAVTNGCLLLRHGRFQSAGKLVGAGGTSAAAVDALQTGNGLLCLHALHQRRNTLEVAVAAAYHLEITDHALIVHLYRHGPGADAPGLECICHIVFPSFLIRLENRITQFFLSAKPDFQFSANIGTGDVNPARLFRFSAPVSAGPQSWR